MVGILYFWPPTFNTEGKKRKRKKKRCSKVTVRACYSSVQRLEWLPFLLRVQTKVLTKACRAFHHQDHCSPPPVTTLPPTYSAPPTPLSAPTLGPLVWPAELSHKCLQFQLPCHLAVSPSERDEPSPDIPSLFCNRLPAPHLWASLPGSSFRFLLPLCHSFWMFCKHLLLVFCLTCLIVSFIRTHIWFLFVLWFVPGIWTCTCHIVLHNKYLLAEFWICILYSHL